MRMSLCMAGSACSCCCHAPHGVVEPVAAGSTRCGAATRRVFQGVWVLAHVREAARCSLLHAPGGAVEPLAARPRGGLAARRHAPARPAAARGHPALGLRCALTQNATPHYRTYMWTGACATSCGAWPPPPLGCNTPPPAPVHHLCLRPFQSVTNKLVSGIR